MKETKAGVQRLLEHRTCCRISISKNTGSMKAYTRFKIITPRKSSTKSVFDQSIQQDMKQYFFPINKESGCFVSDYTIDVLNDHFSE
jgi:hypothetical protein